MEFDLLKVFASIRARHCRGTGSSRSPATASGSLRRSIDIRIARLRRKVEADPENPQVIRTVRGVGYMFVPPRVAVAAHPGGHCFRGVTVERPAIPRAYTRPGSTPGPRTMNDELTPLDRAERAPAGQRDAAEQVLDNTSAVVFAKDVQAATCS